MDNPFRGIATALEGMAKIVDFLVILSIAGPLIAFALGRYFAKPSAPAEQVCGEIVASREYYSDFSTYNAAIAVKDAAGNLHQAQLAGVWPVGQRACVDK